MPTTTPVATAKTSTKSVATPKATGTPKVISTATISPIAGDGLVHINSATEAELESLPGIGPSYAEKIITYRLQHGGFSSVDDLQNVKGIGLAALAKLKPHIAL